MNKLKPSLLIALLAMLATSHSYAENKQNHAEHKGKSAVHLRPDQVKAAGIVTTSLKPSNARREISAPGEIMLNSYATSQVVSRISAQIVERHAKLGDMVLIGQPLVTLSSVQMAQAQGDLLIAAREWERVKKLGRKVVSASRYIQAKVNNEQALSKLLAYGMSQKQIKVMLKGTKTGLTNGSFQLSAPQDGTIIRDDFILGELVAPGRMLFKISDETSLWVNARLSAEQALDVQVGANVKVLFRNTVLKGKVIQRYHSVDEKTRTIGVRIEVGNPNDLLHPGLFVETKITAKSTEDVLAIPVDAVVRSPDGDWMIFVEHEDNEFEPQEVDVIRTINDFSVIKGVELGSRVVVKGAFFLQSELAKTGFEIHNH
jgi:RND family efflux transporter MFP subunit